MLAVNCACGQRLRYTPEMAGRKARCPGCKSVVRLPAPAATPAAPATGYDLREEPKKPAPARKGKPCPWCARLLGPGDTFCDKCGWGRDTTQQVADKEPRTHEPDRPGWGRLLFSGFNPFRVLVPAFFITLVQVVTLAGVAALALYFPDLGVGSALIALAFWAFLFLFLFPPRWYAGVASRAANGEPWRYPPNIAVWLVYLLYLTLLVGVLAAGPAVAVELAPELTEQVGWEGFLAISIALPALAVLFYVMALTRTGARSSPSWNPFAVLGWIIRCLPHLILTLPTILLASLFWTLLLTAAVGAGLLAASEPLREAAVPLVEQLKDVASTGDWGEFQDKLEQELRKLDGGWIERAEQRDASAVAGELNKRLQQGPPDFTDPVVQWVAGLILLYVTWSFLVVNCVNAVVYRTFGLIAARRWPSLRWETEG